MDKLCLVVSEDRGADSEVAGSFMRGPLYLVADLQNQTYHCYSLQDFSAHYGGDNILSGLSEAGFDALICQDMNFMGYRALRENGIEVYKSVPGSVEENIDLFHSGQLMTMDVAIISSCSSGSCGNCSSQTCK